MVKHYRKGLASI